MGRGPALKDAPEMPFEGFGRLSDEFQEDFAGEAVTGMTDESGDTPAGGLDGLGVAYATQFFLDPPRRCGFRAAGTTDILLRLTP